MANETAAYGSLIDPKFQSEFETDALRIFHGLFRNHFLRIEKDIAELLHQKDLKIEKLTAEVHSLEIRIAHLKERG